MNPDLAPSDIGGLVSHDIGTTEGEGAKKYRSFLDAAIRFGASDLHVKVNQPPRVRVRLKNGEELVMRRATLDHEQWREQVAEVLGPAN